MISDARSNNVAENSSLAKALVTVIIPTLNPGILLDEQLKRLSSQSVVSEIIVIDSGSTDGSMHRASQYSVRVIHEDRGSFHHGATRNRAATNANGQFIVLLTQDALPVDDNFIAELIEPLSSQGVTATYGRHIARLSASPLEQFARLRNYPDTPQFVRDNSIRRYFFSNACSAIVKRTFDDLGGFPTHTIMNEDMIFASRLLRAGHRITYVPTATVEHSHNYTILRTFKRYFDIGVVLEQAKYDLDGAQSTSEGIRYVRGLFTWLWRNGHYAWLPRAFLESAAKWVGTSLGRNYKRLPLSLVRRLSMHHGYWDNPP